MEAPAQVQVQIAQVYRIARFPRIETMMLGLDVIIWPMVPFCNQREFAHDTTVPVDRLRSISSTQVKMRHLWQEPPEFFYCGDKPFDGAKVYYNNRNILYWTQTTKEPGQYLGMLLKKKRRWSVEFEEHPPSNFPIILW